MSGLENRTTILPQPNIPTKVPGIFGPDYSFADNVKLPNEVGVYDGNSINSVVDAVKGAAYYIDTIGFGASSSSLTSELGVKPLGVNTYMRTGFTCSNGADMWMYNAGIPTGNAFGPRIAKGLAGIGMPPLKGLAPGILEDAQIALDPVPIMSAVFGSGFPSCKLQEMRVGDQDNIVQNPETCAYYVENPETVTNIGGVPTQARWVFDQGLTQEQYNATPKTHCPDGIAVAKHIDHDCLKGLVSPPAAGPYVNNNCKSGTSGFCNYSRESQYLYHTIKTIAITAGVLLTIGVLHKTFQDFKK